MMRFRYSHGVTLGLLLMVLSTMLQASMHGIVRFAGNDLHPFVLTFYRNLFGFLFIVPLLLRIGWSSLHSAHYRLLFLRGFLGIVSTLAWYYSLVHVPTAEATILSFTAVMFTSLAAMFFLDEQVRLRRWLAIGCGFVGTIVVIRPAAGSFDPLLVLVVFSTVFWALSITVMKYLTRTDSVTSVVAVDVDPACRIIVSVCALLLAMAHWRAVAMVVRDWRARGWR